MNAHIIGWGKYLPSKIVTNAELAQIAPIDPEWVRTRTGIEARHFAEPHQASADMAIRAARAALQVADLDPLQLDLIICATNSPDFLFPATACLVQDAIGATHAGAFDLGAGCSGFVYALTVADRFIRTGAHRNILVIGVETVSRMLPMHDALCAYFGDGAGAVVLTANEQPGGLLAFMLKADGAGAHLLKLPGGGSRHPLSHQAIEQGLQYGQMDGRAVYRFGLRAMTYTARQLLRAARLTPQEIDLYIPHQTNQTLIHQVIQKLQLPPEKTLFNVARYANISTAAIPVSLCDAIEAGRLKPGHRVLITVFGAGLTYAGLIWLWSQPVAPKPMSVTRRFFHALWDAQAAFRSRFFRLEHHLDALAPTDDEESEEKKER